VFVISVRRRRNSLQQLLLDAVLGDILATTPSSSSRHRYDFRDPVGGIDLSVGSMIGFVGVVMANLDVVGWHPLASAA